MIKQLWKFVITLVLSVTTMQSIAIEQVNVNSSGEASNKDTQDPNYSLSADGRYVAFSDDAANLVLVDNNGNNYKDNFIRDRQTGTTGLVSERADFPSISADGNNVTYSHVFFGLSMNDLQTGEISEYDLSPIELLQGMTVRGVDTSSDGRFSVFYLKIFGCGVPVQGCTLSPYIAESYVYLHDQVTGELTFIRPNSGSDISVSDDPKISADGRYVSFDSTGNGLSGIYVYDRLADNILPIIEITGTSSQSITNGSISSDGRYLTFSSKSDSLVPGDTNGFRDVFVHDRITNETSRINVTSDGTQANSHSFNNSISADGRYIVFDSSASNLVANDTNGKSDIFIHDRFTGNTALAVNNADGSQIQQTCANPGISADGVFVIFACNGELVNGIIVHSFRSGLFIAPNELAKQLEKDIPQDFNGDGKSDVLWRNTVTGENWMYLMNGEFILASEPINTIDDLNWSVAGTGDFDGDGKADILWRNVESGENWIYLMDGTNVQTSQALDAVTNLDWEVQDTGDFDGDGKDDILWRHKQDGQVWMYLMDGINIAASQHVAYTGVDWDIKGVGDFDGDDKADILWRNNVHGRVWLYGMNGAAISASNHVAYTDPDHWEILGVGDHNGDTKADILWRNSTTGSDIVFLMNSHSILITKDTGYQIPAGGVDVKALGDYDGNGRIDLFMRGQTNGLNSLILSSGQNSFNYDSPILNTIDYDWEIQ